MAKRKVAGPDRAVSCIEVIRDVLVGSDAKHEAIRIEQTTWPLGMIVPKMHKYVADGGLAYVQVGIGVDADMMVGFDYVEERDGYAVYRKASGGGDSSGADDEHV